MIKKAGGVCVWKKYKAEQNLEERGELKEGEEEK